jgi:glycosyltransferase involved in cell wall biosynthesis
MRILEVLPTTELGGAEIALLQRLSAVNGVSQTTVTVVDLGSKPGPLAEELGRYAKVEQSQSPVAWWIRKLAKSSRPDLIVCHSPRAAVLAYLANRSLHRRFPYVVMIHGTRVSDSRLKSLLLSVPLWFANRRSVLVIGVSTPASRSAWARGARQVVVCPLGSRLTDGSEVDAATKWPSTAKIRLLTLSRMTISKNYEMLLDAIHLIRAELRDVGAVCAIIGSGRSKAHLVQKAVGLGIDDLVAFHETTDAPGAVMRMADVLLISSTNEGGPLTFYEALLAGTRVVSTKVGVVPEILAGSCDDGLAMVEDFTAHGFAAALLDMVQKGPNSAEERSARAQTYQHLDVSVTAPALQRMLSSVAI